MNFQENIEQMCGERKMVKLNLVKVVKWFSSARKKGETLLMRIASGRSRVFSFERGALND
jgi:hypothetical protein